VSERRTCRVLGEENLEAKKESGDDVAGQLLEATEPTAGLLEHDFISESYGLWSPGRDSLHEATGLQIGVAYTTLLQLATGRPDDRDAWSGDFDLFVQWTLLPGEADAGSLGFLVEERHRLFTNITPNALLVKTSVPPWPSPGFHTRTDVSSNALVGCSSAAWRGWHLFVSKLHQDVGFCGACGYDLRKTPSGAECPECGCVPHDAA